jgi:hypothetical protein
MGTQLENEQIPEQSRWSGLIVSKFNFLPVLHQRKFQLPGLFPTLDSMAKGDPLMS